MNTDKEAKIISPTRKLSPKGLFSDLLSNSSHLSLRQFLGCLFVSERKKNQGENH